MIVVSHRGPYRFEANDDGSFTAERGAGGVASTLGAVLDKRDRDATWVAAALSDDDRTAAESGALDDLDIDLRLIALDPELHAMHYDVVSNGTLWFLFHGLFDRVRWPRFDHRFREAWDAYRTVNAAFAEAAADAAAEGDVVLVNDYQLSLTGAQLRDLRPDLRIVHFTHTPFSGPDDLRVLPAYTAEDLCGALARNPAGFHCARWSRAYHQSARDVLGRRAKIAPTFAASLGPDVDALDAVASSDAAHVAARHLDDAVGDRLVIVRSDRIEPSKNIVRGFLAYDMLLEARPGLRGRVVFVAMLYPSRQTLPEYLTYTNEIEQVVARINDRWGTRDWEPILLDERDDFPRSIAAMQRYDVLLVNPIKDGLNLVAKEGPAVNRRDGLLCLSREAGAYDDLRDAAIPVHPYDLEDAARALDRALATPLDERAAIAPKLRALAIARTPADWLADLVAHAAAADDDPA
jgi:trehalose 6-phosphate synthase